MGFKQVARRISCQEDVTSEQSTSHSLTSKDFKLLSQPSTPPPIHRFPARQSKSSHTTNAGRSTKTADQCYLDLTYLVSLDGQSSDSVSHYMKLLIKFPHFAGMGRRKQDYQLTPTAASWLLSLAVPCHHNYWNQH